jgi:hypothetical protein
MARANLEDHSPVSASADLTDGGLSANAAFLVRMSCITSNTRTPSSLGIGHGRLSARGLVVVACRVVAVKVPTTQLKLMVMRT